MSKLWGTGNQEAVACARKTCEQKLQPISMTHLGFAALFSEELLT